jgi:proline racemase
MRDRKEESVSFVNVQAFVEYLETDLDVPDLGNLKIDVVFGRNCFAFFSAEDVNLEVFPKKYRQTGAFPVASFRFYISKGTLAVRLTFSPLRSAANL